MNLCLVALSWGAVEHCPDLKEQLDNAFGLVVALRRGPKTNGGVHAEVLKRCMKPDHLVRPAYTLREALERLWDAPCLSPAADEPPADGPTSDPAPVLIPFPPGHVEDTPDSNKEENAADDALLAQLLAVAGSEKNFLALADKLSRARKLQGGAAEPRG